MHSELSNRRGFVVKALGGLAALVPLGLLSGTAQARSRYRGRGYGNYGNYGNYRRYPVSRSRYRYRRFTSRSRFRYYCPPTNYYRPYYQPYSQPYYYGPRYGPYFQHSGLPRSSVDPLSLLEA